MSRKPKNSSARLALDSQITALRHLVHQCSQDCLLMNGEIERILDGSLSVAASEVPGLEERVGHDAAEIDRQCMWLLLHQQPVAGDLRIVTRCLKLSAGFLRIAQLYRSIFDLLASIPVSPYFDDLKEMNALCARQFSDTIHGLGQPEGVLYRTIDRMDDAVDDRFERFKNRLIEQRVSRDQAAELLMAAKSFERIADYSVRMALDDRTPPTATR